MSERVEPWLYWLTVATAAALFIGIAVSQILLAVTCLLWLVSRARPVRAPRFWKPFAALIAWSLVSLLVSADPAAGFPVVRKAVLIAPALLAATFLTTPERARRALIAVCGVASVAALLGVVQFGLQYSRYLASGTLETDPTVLARITGMMGHWMTFSGEQMLLWSALVPVVILTGSVWGWLPLGVIGASIVLSFTRNAWLGSSAGAIVTSFFVPKKRLAVLLIPVVVVALAASPLILRRVQLSFGEGFAPDRGRLEMIDVGMRMIADHPLVGVGPERIGPEFPRYYRGESLDTFYSGHLHNNFLQLAAERGLPALGIFLWFLGVAGWDLLRGTRRADPAVRYAATAGLAAITAFTIAGLFEFNFGDSEVLMLLFFLISAPDGLGSSSSK